MARSGDIFMSTMFWLVLGFLNRNNASIHHCKLSHTGSRPAPSYN